MDDAACKDHPVLTTADFFPGPGGTRFGKRGELVRETCGSCPVREQCFEYATRTGSTGVWADRLFQPLFRSSTSEETVRIKMKSELG